MSFSTVAERCKFCSLEKAIYTCPKCSGKYCSSKCYKCKEHVQCSELFYRDWVVSSLESKDATAEVKKQMVDVLKRAAERDADDDPEDERPSLEERLAGIDLSGDFDEKILWEHLTQEERDKFQALLKEQKLEDIVPIKKPWWTSSKVNLVVEIGAATNSETVDDIFSKRPAFPVGIKSLSSLTSIPAADCVQYSVVSTLYCYVCVMRFYNFEVRDFTEEIIDDVFYLSPVFSERRNYLTLEEVVQDFTRLVMSSKFSMSVQSPKFFTDDVCLIISGPSNTQPSYYTLCALSDLQTLLSDFCQFLNSLCLSKELKSKKKMALCAIKKTDFLISWSQENHHKLKSLVPKLQLVYLSDIVHDIQSELS